MELARGDLVVVARGVCASRGWAAGRARVIEAPEDLVMVGEGDVAVVRVAWPAASVVLGRVAAVVAETGGVLSSLATLARERAVPCVVGATGVTSSVRDGEWVYVDADAGAVLRLEPVVAAPI